MIASECSLLINWLNSLLCKLYTHIVIIIHVRNTVCTVHSYALTLYETEYTESSISTVQ